MAVSYGSIYLCSTIVYVYFMLRFREFIHDNCMIRASNFAFISLIAVVPLEEAELHPLSKQTVREFMKKGKDSVDYSIQHLLKGDLP